MARRLFSLLCIFYDWRRATSTSRRQAPRSPHVHTAASEFMEVHEKFCPQCNTGERPTIYVCVHRCFFLVLWTRGYRQSDSDGLLRSGAGKSRPVRFPLPVCFCGFIFFSLYFQPPISTHPLPSFFLNVQGLSQQTRGRKHWRC